MKKQLFIALGLTAMLSGGIFLLTRPSKEKIFESEVKSHITEYHKATANLDFSTLDETWNTFSEVSDIDPALVSFKTKEDVLNACNDISSAQATLQQVKPMLNVVTAFSGFTDQHTQEDILAVNAGLPHLETLFTSFSNSCVAYKS